MIRKQSFFILKSITRVMHFVYLVRCSDDSLYCGYTTNLKKRISIHNSKNGAKYTRSRTPVKLIYFEEFKTKSSALKREYQIKQLSRREKQKLFF
jgi:putative endonuclease